MNSIVIDVRERDEFEAEHVEHSIHIPLSEFNKRAPALLRTLSDKSVLLMCRSGKRAALAASEAAKLCMDLQLEVFPGGILEWKKQGKPTITVRKAHLPIIRQVQLIAGSLVLISSLLAYFVNLNFVFIASFVGAGLTLAGATGFCGMAELLARMPWNQSRPNIQNELCQVSSNSSACSNTVKRRDLCLPKLES
jgi:rhodanese-related sulfurtransferase